MKFLIFCLAVLVGTISAFSVRSTRRSGSTLLKMNDDKSQALPFDKRPPSLDGSMIGDVGFDPAGFSIKGDLKWLREAEIVHGRVAQLAVVGMLFPSIYHFAGNPDWGIPEDAFAAMNPWQAIRQAPQGGIGQIFLTAGAIELWRYNRVFKEGMEAGDLGLGQLGVWNPFGFEYTEEEYAEKQLQEIKHCRLGMMGAFGMLVQTSKTQMSIPQQLAEQFTQPGSREFLEGPGALHDYFPQGL